MNVVAMLGKAEEDMRDLLTRNREDKAKLAEAYRLAGRIWEDLGDTSESAGIVFTAMLQADAAHTEAHNAYQRAVEKINEYRMRLLSLGDSE